MSKLKNYFLVLLSGILCGLCFDFEFLAGLIFVAVIPLFWVLLRPLNVKERILFPLIFGTSYLYTSLAWIYEFAKFIEFTDFQRFWIATLALVLIVLYLSVYWVIPFLIFGKNLGRNVKSVVTVACIIVFGEWLQGVPYPLAFPWVRFGNIISPFNLFIQSASLFGSLFVSFIVLLIGGFVTLFILDRKRKYAVIAAGIIAVNLIIGFSLKELPDFRRDNINPPGEEVSVLMVQGNHPGLGRFAHVNEIFDDYCRLIEENITPETDMILTPEVALDFDFYEDEEKRQKLLDICSKYGVILVQCIWVTEDDKDYNSMLCLYPDGTYSDVYSKKRLVPFTERPMFDSIIDRIFPDLMSNFGVTEGSKDTLFDTPAGLMAGIICYENIFPDIARDEAQRGANYAAFVTDDGWFGKSPALYQHKTHSVMRAVENHLGWLQCSNTGITCIIDRNGELCGESPPIQQQTVMTGSLWVRDIPTLYTKLGDYPMLIFMGLWLIYAGFLTKLRIPHLKSD